VCTNVQRGEKRELSQTLARVQAEAAKNKAFADSTATTLAALRRKLADRDATLASLHSAGGNASTAGSSVTDMSPTRHQVSWARKAGVKEGRAQAARQIKLLAAQLAEARAAYNASQGHGDGDAVGFGSPKPSLRASVLGLGSTLSPASGLSPAGGGAASPWRRPSAQHSASAVSQAHLAEQQRQVNKFASGLAAPARDADVSNDLGRTLPCRRLVFLLLHACVVLVIRDTIQVGEEKEAAEKQRAFLKAWAADLAERDRDLSQRMQETNATLRRLQSQLSAARTGTTSTDPDAALERDRKQLALERSEVQAQRSLLRNASAVMKDRLTLQLELLRLTPLISGVKKGVPRAKVSEAKKRAAQVQVFAWSFW